MHYGPEAEQLAESNRDTALLLMRRTLRGQRAKDALYHSLPKVLNAAACLIAMFSILLTTAVAAVPEVRQQLVKLLVQVNGHTAEVTVEKNDQAFDNVPEGWMGDYFPIDIPQEYALSGVAGSTDYAVAEYKTKDGRTLCFSEGTTESIARIETNGLPFTQTEVNGNPAMILENETNTILIWTQFRQYLILSADEGREATMQIAQSVIRVQ